MIKKLFLVILSLFLIKGVLLAVEPRIRNENETPEMAADFTLQDLEDKEFSLSSFKGKPVLLFFWTTWCPHCRKELKLLNDMQAEFLKDGVVLAAINVQEQQEKVKKFIESYSLTYRVLLDKDAEVSEEYGVLGVPTYFFINKEGRIVFNDHYFPQKEYKELILK